MLKAKIQGACGNTYIREERLSTLLGDVVQRIQIPNDVADWIAESLQRGQTEAEDDRQLAVHELEQRKRAVQRKLDRGYEDYLESRISSAFWTRKSAEWEAELATIEGAMSRSAQPMTAYVVTGEKILELAKKAEFLYRSDRTASPARKSAIELHVRRRSFAAIGRSGFSSRGSTSSRSGLPRSGSWTPALAARMPGIASNRL